MPPKSRGFIQIVGITMAGLLLANCGDSDKNVKESAIPSKSTVPTTTGSLISPTPAYGLYQLLPSNYQFRQEVKLVWVSMIDIPRAVQERIAQGVTDWYNIEKGNLSEEHNKALEKLVHTGEIDRDTATQIQQAFEAAYFHVEGSSGIFTCYEPMPPGEITLRPASSAQLVAQSEILTELADRSELSSETLAEVQNTIARDIAFLSLTGSEVDELYESIRQELGETTDTPEFDKVELDVSPESMKAAQYLAALLLEE